MSDPVLISQIISAMGLTGDEALKKRAELEKLSNDELNRLLSGAQSFKKADTGCFSMLTKTEKFNGGIFSFSVQKQAENAANSTSIAPPPLKTLLSCR